jgi:UDP-GlcNAc:undecaprenyl-phosphate/decaprenyl-phosphate GlcNAc-1-phosphate transferase
MFDFWSLIPHSTLLSGIFAMILGAFISFMAIPVIVRVAKAKNLTDKPNNRSSHEQSIPSLGGVAIFAGVLLGAALLVPPRHMDQLIIYTAASTFILFLVGQKDDIVGLVWQKKLLAEVIASLILIVLGNLRFTTLHGLFGVHDIPMWLSVLITLIIFVGIINAFNLIDGIDGLAAGTGIMTSFLMGVWMYGIGAYGMAILAWALTGSLLPFFYFNVFGKKHKLFMGDTGSLMIGLLMAVFAAVICGREVPPTHLLYFPTAPVILISILFYPLYDMLRVIVVRLANGKSPFEPDKNHIHHLFLNAGFSHRRSTFYILIISAMGICWALVFRNASIWFVGGTMLCWALVATWVLRLVGRHAR